MYELFINLPNDKTSIGRFNSELECHQKAEELNLTAYCMTLYVNTGWFEEPLDTWCFTV